MSIADWQRRNAMLAVFYLLALAYACIYPLHFVRAYWDYLWPRFPVLPEQLFPGAPWLLFVSVLLAIPPGLMFAAAWLGVGERHDWRFWWRVALLWLALSVLLLGVVVVQLLFLDALLPRLDPRGLPVGVLLGVLLWVALGRVLVAGTAGLSTALARLGTLPDSVWQLRWVVALLAWWLWLLAGRWGWTADRAEAWVPGPWAWWWLFSWLALFSFSAVGVGRTGGRLSPSVLQLVLTWLALSLLAVVCLLFENWAQTGRLLVGMDLRLLAQQGGMLTGLLVALVMVAVRPTMVAAGGRHWHYLPPALALLMITLAMLPVDPELQLADIGRARPVLSPHVLVQQFYQLIKDAMLWFPVGFIFVVGDRQRLMWVWSGVACAALLLVLLPWFPQWPFGLPASIGAAWAGLLGGVWLARSSRLVAVDEALLLADPVVEPVADPVPVVQNQPLQRAAEVVVTGDAKSGTGDSQGAVRSPRFRSRDQGVVPVANAVDAPVWRVRAVDDEPAVDSGAGGFRSRPAAVDSSTVPDETDKDQR